MDSKKKLFVGMAILVVIVVAVFVFWNKSQREKLFLPTPPIEQPLLLKTATDELTQKQNIREYKDKILNRARLKVPLTVGERINFEIILVKGTNSSGEYMFADQSVLKFTEEELRLISDAIKYK